ncbi:MULTISPECIES: PRD domain-containing protein [unclassified Lactobacillus]|uniref:PRD domain-containing protein n=1 Tax=unclassified Lactobacillus TaxID=2620435 RepID=UPI002269BE69|nr:MULTISPECIES: PRD domain-containing protein [unclassified Lactobacillus]MCX8722082.1 PRD domain-containing protein [Lactobacillus sp. B4010]MCX8732720.1 PRD domain-containing protein [Lactobacillus sp. B4015]MCX8734940.1 PRD domain-containing protein [Lactobacillus sp. B4012]
MIVIKRVLNNNAVVATDEQNQTLVALGSGIAFHQKAGQAILENKIEKSFYPKNEDAANSISETLAQVDPKYIELSDRIISEAVISSGKKLSDDIYVSLPDHLQFAVERLKKGMLIQNKLTVETMQTYPDEFQLGKHTLSYLAQETGLTFPDDEATNIAMHLITAEEGDILENTEETITLINQFLKVISAMLKKEFNLNSVSYYRLVTHLKFFVQRIKKRQHQEFPPDKTLYDLIIRDYHAEYLIAQRIAGIVMKKFNYGVSDDEILFLTIHIHRVNAVQ